jgi:hypothetical protein
MIHTLNEIKGKEALQHDDLDFSAWNIDLCNYKRKSHTKKK